jgi:hypothetical protein
MSVVSIQTVEPGYNNNGLFDTWSIASDILWYQLIIHRDLRSSGMLCSADWYLPEIWEGLPVPTSTVKQSKKNYRFDCLTVGTTAVILKMELHVPQNRTLTL